MPIVGQFGSLAGLGSLILPGGAMESIATVTVGSGGTSSISFSSIPSTYQHLQIRGILRSTRAAGDDGLAIRFNGATANYAWHYMVGGWSGSTVNASAGTSAGYGLAAYTAAANDGASMFGGFVIDVLDYATASKNRVARSFWGEDSNGSGAVGLSSFMLASTTAVSSLELISVTGGSWVQHSTVALYGIKAP